MARPSRRAVIATMASAVIAGCPSDGPGGDTVTPYELSTTSTRTEEPPPMDGPEPLGYHAVPDDAGEPPEPGRERVYETDQIQGVVSLVDHPDGARAALYTRGESGLTTPELLGLDETGALTDRRPLSDVPSNRVSLGAGIEDVAVIGAQFEVEETRHTWLQGYRDGNVTFRYETPLDTQLVYADLAVLNGDLVAVGHVDASPESYEDQNAILARIQTDGTVAWEQRVESPQRATDFWAVTTTAERVYAGGTEDNAVLVAAYTSDGTEQWQVTLRRGEQAYIVDCLAAGPTGLYALARTNQFAMGNNHLLLLAFDPDGTVHWTRVFDPNRDRSKGAPQELYPAGVVDEDGPLVVGRTQREHQWLAKCTPDGAVEWAGYRRTDDRPTRPLGVSRIDGEAVVHGSVGRLEAGNSDVDPWLAWL